MISRPATARQVIPLPSASPQSLDAPLAGMLGAHWGSAAAVLFAAVLLAAVAPLLGLFGWLAQRMWSIGG